MEEISKIFSIDESLISYSRELEQLSIKDCEIDTSKILDITKNLGTYKTIEFSNVSFKHFNLHKLLKNFGKVYNNNLEIKSNIIFSNCDILEWEEFENTIKFENEIYFNNIKKCCKLHFKNLILIILKYLLKIMKKKLVLLFLKIIQLMKF